MKKWSLGSTLKVLTAGGLVISFVSSLVSEKIQKQEIKAAVEAEVAKLNSGN